MKKILILLFMFSCSKEVDDLGFRVYTIPAGKGLWVKNIAIIRSQAKSREVVSFVFDIWVLKTCVEVLRFGKVCEACRNHFHILPAAWI